MVANNSSWLRAWWWHRQGLDGSLAGRSPAEVLDRSGWARSVGGVGPYLTFFSRAAASREAVDRAVAAARGLKDLPSHAILDRGRLVGLWEFDPQCGEIVWTAWAPSAGAAKNDKALLEAVSRTQAFIRKDLGDARSFSLDSPKSRAPRIAAIRRA